MRVNPELRTVRSPYDDGEELVAVPALRLDAALVHINRADARGNGQYLGPDPYFDDLFCHGRRRGRYVSCERIVPTAELPEAGPPQTPADQPRRMVHGVVEAPNGAHFTSCVPDYGRDEAFQRAVRRRRRDPAPGSVRASVSWPADEAGYQAAVTEFAASQERHRVSTDCDPGRVCVVACAEAWRGDGEILASPMGLIPTLGARLARLTFAPDLLLTDGEAMLVGARRRDAPRAGCRTGRVCGWSPAAGGT